MSFPVTSPQWRPVLARRSSTFMKAVTAMGYWAPRINSRRFPKRFHVPRFSVLVLPFFLFAVLSCSTLHKNAETLMEGEEFEEAAKVYAQILDRTPTDAKALVGLKKARANWIDKKLIDVRMLRLSEQAVPAIELLIKIIQLEREWQFYPEGAVQFTQQEETNFAVQLVSAQIDAWQARGHLLKARVYLEAHSPIFASPALIERFERLSGQLRQAAKEQCDSYKSHTKPSRPHLATFAKRYCGSWGISFDAGFDVVKARAASLFREVKIIAKGFNGISDALQAQGHESLVKELQATAWYDSEASLSLRVEVNAEFAQDHRKTIEDAVHSYAVQVPYTKMIPQFRLVPHITYQRFCTTYHCTSIPTTTYTYEAYTIPVTKYRDDPRQLKYDRWRHTQTLSFHAEMFSLVGGLEIRAVHTKAENDTDTEHLHYLPDVGLYPDPLSLIDPLRWLQRQLDEAAHKWGGALSKGWIQTYCSASEGTIDEETLAEYVLRCLREGQDPQPSFADTWYKEKFGASYQDVEQWLNHADRAPIPLPDILKVG